MTTNPIAGWLTESPHSSFNDPVTLVLVETSAPGKDVKSHLSLQMAEHQMPIQVVEDMANILGWERVNSRLTPSRLQIRNGDFGEMLACRVLETFGALEIPVKKVRFKINSDQTQPGADIVGLEIEDDRIVAIHFAEAKFRTTGDTAAGNAAHQQLESWHKEEFEQIAMFIGTRLYETQRDLYSKFMDYLSAGTNRADEYHIVLVWDNERWTDTVLSNIQFSDQIDPLTIRTVLIKDLTNLTSEIYHGIEESVRQ